MKEAFVSALNESISIIIHEIVYMPSLNMNENVNSSVKVAWS